MSANRDVVDWEQKLASIIEKSNRNLHRLSTEYSEIKSKRQQGLNPSYSRPVLYPPPPPVDNDAGLFYNHTDDNVPSCGPYQKAAMSAFHAAKNNKSVTRPISKSAEDEIVRRVETRLRQSVDRMVNDKLVVTSRAIDALRDQISVLADEVRQLNKDASCTAKCISSQERTLEVLRHDVDSRREAMLKMEAHILDENSWRNSVGSEFACMKQALAQQNEAIAAKASSTEVKSGFESAKLETNLSIAAAISPLQLSVQNEIEAILKGVNSVKENLEQEVSQQIRPLQNSIMESVLGAVAVEVEAAEKRCKEHIENDLEGQKCQSKDFEGSSQEEVQHGATPEHSKARHENVDSLPMITHIVTEAVSNLRSELSLKMDKDLGALKSKLPSLIPKKQDGLRKYNELQKELSSVKKKLDGEMTEVSSLKEYFKRLYAKQSHCITNKKVEELIEACRASLSEKISQLGSEKEDAISVMADSISQMSAVMKSCVTKDAVSTMVKQESEIRFGGIMKDVNTTTMEFWERNMKPQLNGWKAEVTKNVNGESTKIIHDIKAAIEQLEKLASDVKLLSMKVDEAESLRKEESRYFSESVKSLEQRVQIIETEHKSLNNQIIASKAVEIDSYKANIDCMLRSADEKLDRELSTIRAEIDGLSEKIDSQLIANKAVNGVNYKANIDGIVSSADDKLDRELSTLRAEIGNLSVRIDHAENSTNLANNDTDESGLKQLRSTLRECVEEAKSKPRDNAMSVVSILASRVGAEKNQNEGLRAREGSGNDLSSCNSPQEHQVLEQDVRHEEHSISSQCGDHEAEQCDGNEASIMSQNQHQSDPPEESCPIGATTIDSVSASIENTPNDCMLDTQDEAQNFPCGDSTSGSPQASHRSGSDELKMEEDMAQIPNRHDPSAETEVDDISVDSPQTPQRSGSDELKMEEEIAQISNRHDPLAETENDDLSVLDFECDSDGQASINTNKSKCNIPPHNLSSRSLSLSESSCGQSSSSHLSDDLNSLVEYITGLDNDELSLGLSKPAQQGDLHATETTVGNLQPTHSKNDTDDQITARSFSTCSHSSVENDSNSTYGQNSHERPLLASSPDDQSLVGSLTSFDEVACIKNPSSNNNIYENWEACLGELRLQMNESTASSTQIENIPIDRDHSSSCEDSGSYYGSEFESESSM